MSSEVRKTPIVPLFQGLFFPGPDQALFHKRGHDDTGGKRISILNVLRYTRLMLVRERKGFLGEVH